MFAQKVKPEFPLWTTNAMHDLPPAAQGFSRLSPAHLSDLLPDN